MVTTATTVPQTIAPPLGTGDPKNAQTDPSPSQSSEPRSGVLGYQPSAQDIRAADSARPTMLAQARPAQPVVVTPVKVTVPHALFAKPDGSTRDPTIATEDGRRWMPAADLAHYLRNSGHPLVSAADLIAFNRTQAQSLGGREVFEVGRSVNVLPGAAAVARAGGDTNFSVNAGLSSVVGGNVGGPASVYALTPVDSRGRPQFGETKIFYSIPGTPVVGAFKPSDMSMGTGLGGSVTLAGVTLFGNVRMEVGSSTSPNSRLTPTGFSINGGILFPLLGRPGETGGVAGAASVMGRADWGMIMRVWSQMSVL
jgi:hypothetical protein